MKQLLPLCVLLCVPLAANPSTGEVYLVTDYHGVDLTQPDGIGTLHSAPVTGSFQVLDIGH